MYRLLIIFVGLTALNSINGYRGPFRRFYSTGKETPLEVNDDPGEALFLTPYIEQGKIEEARNLRLISFH
jgi:hypothetical protein